MASSNDWRPLYPFCTRHIELDGHRMHYIDEGQDSPGNPLLFVHGNPTWSFYWRNFVRELRPEHRCIAVDHIGCGFSDKPQNYDYCLRTHADNLKSVIKELDLNNITLLAHDWGGAIGMLAATEMPERFSRFVLFNTGAFPPPRVPLRIASCRIPFLGTLGMRGLNSFAAAAQVMASHKPGGLDPAVLAGLILPYDSWANRVAIDAFVRDIPLTKKHPTYAVLEKLENDLGQFKDHPFQFIWGMEDWCFTPACLDQFLTHLPNAEVDRLTDAGHWVIEDDPDRCLKSVREFLTKNSLPSAMKSAT